MNSIITFLIGNVLLVTVATALLYVTYRLLFSNTNRFGAMRAFLICSLVFAFVLPFLKFNLSPRTPQSVAVTQNLIGFFTKQDVSANDIVMLDEVTVATTHKIWGVIGWTYGAGVLLFALLFLYKLLKIGYLYISCPRKRKDGCTIVYTHRNHISFSFFNSIFLPEGESSDVILRHEKSHIQHRHSWDVVFVELLTIFQWFNPIIRLYKSELQSIHEFIADKDVLCGGAPKSDYMMLILQQCTAGNFSTISNNFSFNLTKKRFQMMTQESKTKGMFWRILGIVPIAALLLVVNGNAAANELSSREQLNSSEPQSEIVSPTPTQVTEPITQEPETLASYPGGQSALATFISENIKYPEDAKKNNIKGTVYVSFVVDADGSITDITVKQGIGHGCDEEAVRVVKMMPKWNPATQNSKAVRCHYMLPIKFILR